MGGFLIRKFMVNFLRNLFCNRSCDSEKEKIFRNFWLHVIWCRYVSFPQIALFNFRPSASEFFIIYILKRCGTFEVANYSVRMKHCDFSSLHFVVYFMASV